MKKYLSLFSLAARGSLHRIAIISILTSAVEMLLFHLKLKESMMPYILGILDFRMPQLESVIDGSGIQWIAKIGFILIIAELIRHGCESNTKSIYTYQRLSVSERGAFYSQGAYNAMAFMIFWATQVITLFCLCLWYVKVSPDEYIGNQTIFLAFFRNNFLHSMMPVTEVSVWIRNAILAICLGFTAAEFPFKQRRKKFAVTVLGLGLYTVIFFSNEFGSNGFNTFIMIAVSICCLAEALYTVHTQWNVEVTETDENN